MRTPLALSASAALAGALLLTACGTEVAGSQRSAGANVVPTPSATAACGLPRDPADAAKDGVKITGVTGGSIGCGAASSRVVVSFGVTNHEAEALTYTVQFQVVAASGEGLMFPTQTVPGVGTGRSVQATLDIGDVTRHGVGAHVEVYRVRAVPAAEAPAAAGPCPPSGIRVTADQVDAAMGLRVVGLRLSNCSARPYHVSGFPQTQLLDLQRRPVTGVSVLHGSGGITTGTDFDAPPRAFTLQPGESATSGLMWRNTVTDGSPVEVPYVRVIAQPGAQPVMVTPELDLGTTGKLGVSPWQKAASR